MYSVFGAFRAAADATPHKPFLYVPSRRDRGYFPAGREFSYGEFDGRVLRLREQYIAAGYGHGHRVALLLENRPDFLLHWLALNGIGASIVPINPAYRAAEIAYLIGHAEPDLIVALPDRAELAVACREISAPLLLEVSGDDLGRSIERMPAAPRAAKPGPAGSTGEAALLYTSGTTARPKGCILTNEYIMSAGRWYTGRGGEAAYRFGGERLYSPLPLFHMAGLTTTTLAMILTGGCLILPERFNAKSFWNDIVESRATAAHYLGIIVASLLNQPPSDAERRHRLRFAMGVGATPELRRKARERFGIPFVEGWGMTETGRSCFNTVEPLHLETNTIGRSEPGLELAILDDAGRPVAPGTVGELCARFSADEPRKGFFAGYLKDPQATELAWRGGWFHTGDSAWQHDDGALVFVDRLKHLIRRSGENISAAEVESVLGEAPGVKQSAVVAGADALREEEVVAFVVADRPGSRELASDVFRFAAQRLAYFKLPAWIAFVDELPMTSTNKIQKHSLLGPGKDPSSWPGIFDLRNEKTKSAKSS